jgi:hypothetical protein
LGRHFVLHDNEERILSTSGKERSDGDRR